MNNAFKGGFNMMLQQYEQLLKLGAYSTAGNIKLYGSLSRTIDKETNIVIDKLKGIYRESYRSEIKKLKKRFDDGNKYTKKIPWHIVLRRYKILYFDAALQFWKMKYDG